jgi:uncharacterized membrane protein
MVGGVLCALCGCGSNDTFSPTAIGSGGSFTLAPNPATSNVTQGQSVSYTITGTSTGTFSSTVGLSASGLPVGTTAMFAPTSITPTANGTNSTLTITTSTGSGDLNGTVRSSPATPVGTHTVTVTGTGGGITKQTSVQMTVNAPNNNED